MLKSKEMIMADIAKSKPGIRRRFLIQCSMAVDEFSFDYVLSERARLQELIQILKKRSGDESKQMLKAHRKQLRLLNYLIHGTVKYLRGGRKAIKKINKEPIQKEANFERQAEA